MNSERAADGTLRLTYDGTGWSRLMLIGAAAFAFTAAYDLTIGSRGDDRLAGLIGGIATCVVGGLMLHETARVRVDPQQRLIEWDRRWALQHRSGTVRFDDVRMVVLERPIGDDGTPSRRVVLHLRHGEMIPLTVGYRPDVDHQITKAAEELRTSLGHAADPPSADLVRALVAGGKKIDAIMFLVEHEHLSLVEAKARVDELVKPG